MDFGALRRAGFYAVRDVDEGNFGANCVKLVSLCCAEEHFETECNYFIALFI